MIFIKFADYLNNQYTLHNMKKLLTLFLLASLAASAAWAADETITFSSHGYSNAQDMTTTTVSGDYYTISFSKGTNSTTPKYYTSGTAVRLYGGNTFTVSSTKTITRIELTFGSGGDSNEITTDVDTYTDGSLNGIWTGSASSVTFTVDGSTGNRRLSSISISYNSEPTIAAIATYIFNTSDGLNALNIAVPGTGERTYLVSGSSYKVKDVSLTQNYSGGLQGNSIYNHGTYGLELCVQNGGSLTFSVPDNCTITKIAFTGSNINKLKYNNNASELINNEWSGVTQSITFSNNSTSIVYVYTITVTYIKTIEDVPTVEGIADFKNVDAETTVKLYLPDANNARVTHVETNSNGTVDAYVRDNTGAMRMTGISPNRPMTYNQHLAGWITGKYTVGSDGIPQFEPAEDLTNTAFFVIADPVTESDTKPVEINSNQVGDHLADWVTIKDVTVDNSIDNTKFNLDYSADVYNGALVDVDAIAANGKLYPVNDDNGYPITFVVDASKSFVSPSTDISDAKIRLKRTLSASNWNFLTVPFDIYESEFDGQVLEYTGIELGKVGEYTYHGQVYDITGGIMKFEPYSGTMFAGKPYLVKPASAVEEQTFMEVTLSKSAPSVVKYSLSAAQGAMGIGTMENTTPVYVGDYSLVGTYEPTTLPKNESTVMLDGNEISWTSLLDDTDVNATEAYITIPDGAGVMLDLGTNNGTVTAINTVMVHNENAGEQVIYNLMGVRMTRPLSELPPGVYIVNGKKIVKR